MTLFSEEIRWSSKQAALDLSLFCTPVMVLSFSLTLVPAHHQLARIGVLEVRGFVFHRDLPSMFGQVLTRGARPRSNLLCCPGTGELKSSKNCKCKQHEIRNHPAVLQ